MKKIFIFLAVVIIIVAIVGFRYISYKTEYNTIQIENEEYKKYLGENITGLDVASVINKAVDKNTKNNIEKDDKGNFIENDTNSIKVEIYMTDNETKYQMETIFNGGTEQFVQYYGNIDFSCSKIEYHKNTGRIKYILFEQQPEIS